MEPFSAPASGTEPPEEISDTERAIYGSVTLPELRAFLATWAKNRMGSTIAEVRFRAGRIDVVWTVELQDGRAVVIKTHRTQVHLDAIRAAIDVGGTR